MGLFQFYIHRYKVGGLNQIDLDFSFVVFFIIFFSFNTQLFLRHLLILGGFAFYAVNLGFMIMIMSFER